MSQSKKRKVDLECRNFNEAWTVKYLFTNIDKKAICLVCQETIAVFKEYNLNRHLLLSIINCQISLSKCFQMILIVFLSKKFLGPGKNSTQYIRVCTACTRYSPPALETF